jgi:TolB-like protein
VLAFSDLSAEGNQGYFADGIAEEILNVLAHVNGLKVASRTSSFMFRKSDLGTTAIAQKLGVRHILEGSVRKAGDNVRITAQLIDASTDQHEWSQSFDRPLSTANLFAIQDEIAKNIVDHLGATMGGATDIVEPVVRKADTTDVDAYDLYLKGRALFIARSKGNLSEAARVLKRVVAKDPGFARAWETLAAVLVVSRGWGLVEERDYHQAALDAADRALRLDPGLSLAYAVRGRAQINMIPNGDKVGWDESLTNLSEAIRRDAQNATVLLWLGQSYATLGFQDRAAENYERCLKIDPAYEICRRNLALTHLYIGRTDDALRLYELGLARGYMAGYADAQFAPAAVARGDRLGALGMLAQQCRDQPQLIQPLFRALTDATFSETDRQEALSLVDKKNDDPDRVLLALWMLKAYDQMIGVAAADFPTIFWARDDAAWLKSSGRKKMMQPWRLPDYWRKHGFPPQCRPIGESDFECR